MLEAWKRQEKRIALRWGMNNFETKELDRPEFKGTYEFWDVKSDDVVTDALSGSKCVDHVCKGISLLLIVI